MATAPVSRRLNLTRDQLAAFLTDQQQIRQFELLFATVDAISPDVVNEINIAAGSAQATANEAISSVLALAQETAVSVSAAENKANQALAILDRLASAIEGLQMAPVDKPLKRTRYGQFQDTTTQVAALPNTAYPITYNSTDLSSGVYLKTTSEIEIDTAGVYDFQFSVQVDKTSGGTGNFWIWPRLNGVDVPSSCSQVQVQGNNAEVFCAANFFFDLKAGDVVQFMWAASDVSVQLQYFPATAFHPAIPSIIVTVSNNIRSYP